MLESKNWLLVLGPRTRWPCPKLRKPTAIMMEPTKNKNPKLSNLYKIQTTRLPASLEVWTALLLNIWRVMVVQSDAKCGTRGAYRVLTTNNQCSIVVTVNYVFAYAASTGLYLTYHAADNRKCCAIQYIVLIGPQLARSPQFADHYLTHRCRSEPIILP